MWWKGKKRRVDLKYINIGFYYGSREVKSVIWNSSQPFKTVNRSSYFLQFVYKDSSHQSTNENCDVSVCCSASEFEYISVMTGNRTV